MDMRRWRSTQMCVVDISYSTWADCKSRCTDAEAGSADGWGPWGMLTIASAEEHLAVYRAALAFRDANKPAAAQRLNLPLGAQRAALAGSIPGAARLACQKNACSARDPGNT